MGEQNEFLQAVTADEARVTYHSEGDPLDHVDPQDLTECFRWRQRTFRGLISATPDYEAIAKQELLLGKEERTIATLAARALRSRQ